MMEHLLLVCDGGCDNLGHKNAYGSVALLKNRKVEQIERYKFHAARTNQEAEYSALLKALWFILEYEKNNGSQEWEIWTDSQLVQRQLSGRYKVKAANLKSFYELAKEAIQKHGQICVTWVPREKIVAVLGH